MDDRNKKLIAIGAGLGCVAICFVVAVLAFVIIDPFGWFGGIFGGGDPIAEAVPAETDVYISLNMVELLSSDAQAVVETIINSIPGADAEGMEDMIDEMVDDLFSSYGLTYASDIERWIGQHMGVSLSNMRFDRYGDISEPDMILAIEVRDRGAADDFIADYIDASEYELDVVFSSSDYRGATIYEAETALMAIGRSGGILYFGNSAYAVEDAIDAQKGDSLADEQDFARIASQFPNRRFATIYMSSNFFEAYMELAGIYGGVGGITPSGLQSMAMTLSFTDIGIQLDAFVGVDEGQIDEAQLELLTNAQSGGDIISMLPEDTLAFYVGQGMDQVWQNFEDIMELSSGGDFNEAMRFFSDSFGIRPDQELFPILDGEWALTVISGSGSELGQELGGMGLMLLAESSEEDELEDVVSDSADALGRSGLDIRERAADGGMLYIAGDRDVELFSFGVQDGVFLIGTDSNIMLDAMQGVSSLDDDRAYHDVWGAFPRGTTPVLYVNLDATLEAIMEMGDSDWEDLVGEMGFDLRPFTHLAAGSSGLDHGVAHATIVIFVDTDYGE